MWDVDDDVLLAAFAVGDAVAGAVFVRRYQRRVLGLARSIVGDRALAEELAQEAFVRAWRHASSYDPRRGSVATWLLTITRNVALDAAPDTPAHPVEHDLAGLLLVLDCDGDPAQVVEHRDEVHRVMTALRQVPELQRRALVLAAMFGRTANEVSEIEGVPLGTAKTRIRAGLIKLRDRLAATREQEVR